MTTLLTVRGLSFSYEDAVPVLADVSLAVLPGRVTLLRGPNGVGKSTLCGLISGTLPPTRAFCDRVTWHGRSVAWSQLQGEVAYAPAAPCLFPHLTGMENLRVIASLFDESPGYVDEVVFHCEAVRLDAAALAQPVRHYSSGMLQKLWVTLMLARSVDLVVLDEPFGNLDTHSIEHVCAWLSEARPAVLVSLHQVPACFPHHDLVELAGPRCSVTA